MNGSDKAASPTLKGTAPLWRPDWRWHLRLLAAVYVVVAVFYFSMDAWLSRLPVPYRLREVPKEMTPWLKK